MIHSLKHRPEGLRASHLALPVLASILLFGSPAAHSQAITELEQAVACGEPVNGATNYSGVTLYRECDGPWVMVLGGVPGAGTIKATGRITSESTSLYAFPGPALESSDTIGNSTRADYDTATFAMTTVNPWYDDIRIRTPPNEGLCIGLSRITGGEQLYVGPDRIPAGLGPIDPETLEPCQFADRFCTRPTYDKAVDQAVFTWVDCGGYVHVVSSGGAEGRARIRGHAYSTTGFRFFRPLDFNFSESANPYRDGSIRMNFRSYSGAENELLLVPNDGGEVCIQLTEGTTPGIPVLVGGDRTPVTHSSFETFNINSSFNPRTGEPCERPGYPCDDPTLNPDPVLNLLNDSALVIWKNCDGRWVLRLTGTASDGGVVQASGMIRSTAGIRFSYPHDTDYLHGFYSERTSLYGYRRNDTIEDSDTFSRSDDGTVVNFDMATQAPWQDYFAIQVDGDAPICIDMNSALDGFVDENIDILIGPERTPVVPQPFGAPFDPETLLPC